MKKLSTKSKIYLSFQIIFMILTIVGGILLFVDKMDNANMVVCCAAMSLAFGTLHISSRQEDSSAKKYMSVCLIILGILQVVFAIADIKMSMMIPLVFGAALVVFGVITLLNAFKKK